MALNETQVTALLLQHLSGTLTPDNRLVLESWVSASPENRAQFETLTNRRQLKYKLQEYTQLANQDLRVILPASHRIRFRKIRWLRYAAVLLIFFGLAAYFYFNRTIEKPVNGIVTHAARTPDVLPGGNKAMLTLADGSIIVLDSAANGQLATDGGEVIRKTASGIVVYDKDQSTAASYVKLGACNTMRTPKGGQFELVLPDGTHVWLNAASSITYPTQFTGKKRRVQITGEAYFEVAKNSKQPFSVSVNDLLVDVLGTHFNVNAYGDENLSVNTTLLEGSVMVRNGIAIERLQPKQQAQLSRQGRLKVLSDVQVENIMAWKNGLFNFDHQSLETDLRQVARWYNITVIFEGKPPSIKLEGMIERSLTLSELLKGLNGMGLKADIREGNKLVIHEQ